MKLRFEGAMGYTWIKTALYYKERPSQDQIVTRTKQFKLMIIAWLSDLSNIASKVNLFDHAKDCVK